jgi:amino acid adenylation domain-containing protein/thioester reductase-like protein
MKSRFENLPPSVQKNHHSLDKDRETVGARKLGERLARGTGDGTLMRAHADLSNGPHPATLVDMLRLRAKLSGAARVYSFLHDDEPRESLTFGELDRRARAVAQGLRAHVAPGDRVLLLFPPGLDYTIAFYGCLYAGCVAVPAFPPDDGRVRRGGERLAVIVADAGARLALSTRSVLDSGTIARVLPELPALPSDELAGGDPTAWQEPPTGSGGLALLQYTSGSTSSPRGVMLTHRNMLHNAEIQRRAWRLSSASVGVSWLPLYHDLGVITCLVQPIFSGFAATMMSPASFMRRPLSWLQAISEERGTFAGGPNFAFDLCVRKTTAAQRAALDLSTWDRAFNGAEPIRPETLREFAEAFAPSGFRANAMYPCYGLAEANFVSGGLGDAAPIVTRVDREQLANGCAVRAAPDSPAERVRAVVGCGTWQDEQHVCVVDPETRELREDGVEGEIWLGGPSVAEGYWGRSEESADSFGARLANGTEGTYFRTGDLGFVLDGELHVAGRLKDLLIVRGRNHHPQDIERTVQAAHPALRPGCGVAFSIDGAGEERLVIVQEVEGELDTDQLFADLRQHIAEQHDLSLYAAALVRPGTIPKTTSGKLQRRACRQAFLENTLDIVAGFRSHLADVRERAADGSGTPGTPLGRRELERRLVAWLAPRLGVDPAELSTTEPLARYGLDSRAAVDLSAELESWLGRRIPATIAYAHPSVSALAEHLAGSETVRDASTGRAPPQEPIAIVGIGCRLPGASGPAEYWALLRDGIDAVTEVPSSRWDARAIYHADPSVPGKTHSKWGGFVDQIDGFDPLFFGISPREAAHVDPQQRLLLEVSWEALEDAGIPPSTLAGSNTGVFVGITTDDYGKLAWARPREIDAFSAAGTLNCIAANRISYVLDLRGPSMAIDTACSASLVAVHEACQSLWSGETTVAIAGGVNLMLTPENTISQTRLGMLAADGRCKAFDTRADGFVRGEGAGIVVLKRLSRALADGDRIHALVRGTAVTQDGRSNGLTAPNPEAQKAVLREAYRHAGISPGDVQVVEAHGTGTSLGDPIEARALGEVLAEGRPPGDRCVIGSVKTNIGHLESAAGVAGLIKMTLALSHGEIPRSLHYTAANPAIPFEAMPLRVATAHEPWPTLARERLAGVSSFGMGGTNAHVVLSSAPPVGPGESGASAGPMLLPLSARSAEALRARAGQLREALSTLQAAEVVHTAGQRSEHHEHRAAVVGSTSGELAEALRAIERGEPTRLSATGTKPASGAPPLCFVFSGHGSQHAGMGRALFAEQPVFERAIRRCDEVLAPHLGWSIADAVANGAEVERFDRAQPMIFAMQVALAALWESRGVVPDLVVGHSVGEIAASVVTGALSLEDAAAVVALRCKLLARASGPGEMTEIELSLPEAQAAIAHEAGRVSVAVSDSPASTVIAGEPEALARVVAELRARGVACRAVSVDVAAHGHLVEPFRAELEAGLARIAPRSGLIRYVSSVTSGELDTASMNAAFWGRHLREPVMFAAAIESVAESGATYLEISPHPLLTTAIARVLEHAGRKDATIASLRREQPDEAAILAATGALYAAGRTIDFARLPRHGGRVVALPPYPWQRARYWLADAEVASAVPPGTHPFLHRSLWDAGGGKWRAELDASRTSPRFAADHAVSGSPVWCGLAFTEMARAGAVAALGAGNYAVTEIELRRALFLSDELRVVQLVITPEAASGGAFEIASRAGDDPHGAWTVHIAGRVERARDPRPAADLDHVRDIRARCSELVTDDEFHHALDAQGMHFGPCFRGLERLWRRDGEALGEVVVPRALAADLEGYGVHPAILDACARALIGTTPAVRAFMPISIERVHVHEPAEGRLWSHAIRVAEDRGGLRGDIRVFSEAGELVAEILGARLRYLDEIEAPGAGDAIEQWRYEIAWRHAPALAGAERRGGPWVVLADRGGTGARLAEALRRMSERCVVIEAGPALARLDVDRWSASPGDVGAALASVLDEGRCRGVIHLWSLDAPDNDRATDPAARDLGLGSLFAALSAIASQDLSVKLFVVTRGAVAAHPSDPPAKGAAAALWGAGRTLAVEHAGAWGKLIDLDPSADLPSESRSDDERLAEEIQADGAEDQIALRGRDRLVPRLVRAAVGGTRRPLVWRKDATYLVTGGLGGIGLEVARFLAELGARRLLLLGRSPLPPRSMWRDAPAQSRDADRIAKVRAIEALGASVHVVAVDVGDEAALTRALAIHEQEGWPEIRGVIHAAAISSVRAATSIDVAALDADLRPKVAAARALDRWFLDRPLDFFVAFSSISAVLPSPLLASYAAANAFLDALMQDRRARGLPATTINWGMWADVGLSARHETAEARDRGWSSGSLSPRQGLEAFADVLAAGDAQAIIARMDWHEYAASYPSVAARPMLAELVAGRSTRDALPAPDDREDLDALPPEALALRVHEILSSLAAEVLGIGDAHIDEAMTLDKLGLDSLMAAELSNAVTSRFSVTLPLVAFLQSPTLRQLVSKILSARTAGSGARPQRSSLAVVPRDRDLPLSPAQAGLAYLDELTPARTVYFMTLAYRIDGALDLRALDAALTALTARHEALRTTFPIVDGARVQRVAPPSAPAVTHVDLTGYPVTERAEALRAWCSKEARTPADLARGPLFRAGVVRISEHEHMLTFGLHHIVADGWSMRVMAQDLGALYDAARTGDRARLAPLEAQLADWVGWQGRLHDDGEREAMIAFWQHSLAGVPHVLTLPTDLTRPAVPTYTGDTVPMTIAPELGRRLAELARAEGATTFMALFAAIAVVLGRHASQDDFVIGSPVANRGARELERSVGFFNNMLPLRADLRGAPTFRELLARTRVHALGAYDHQSLPLSEIVHALHVAREPAFAPLFQVELALQPAMPPLALAGATGHIPEILEDGTSRFDLYFHLVDRGDGSISGGLEYATDLFDRPTIERLTSEVATLIAAATKAPDTVISALPLLDAEERDRVRAMAQGMGDDYPADWLVDAAIEAQAARTPDATAVVFGAERVTYADLDARANRLAHHLIALGVGPEQRVALLLDRSVEMVVAIVAVLRAGGAYVPLDAEHPASRLAFMLANAAPRVLLTQTALLDVARTAARSIEVVAVDEDAASWATQPSSSPSRANRSASQLAYVIYTSGSTGEPKGGMNTHHALANRLLWMQDAYGLTAADRVLQKTPYTFDVSVWEFLWPLMVGATLVVARPGGHRDPAYLRDVIVREGVTTMHFVPSMLQAFVLEHDIERCTSLSRVICSGEALPFELTEVFHERLAAELTNLYGPTEAAIDVTIWRCPRGRVGGRRIVPIGKPIAGTRIHVLDRHGEPVPIGVAGELHIAGRNVGRGYLGRADLTADRFVPDPFSEAPGARMYRTGDRCCLLPTGDIEYLGRVDHQVKLRGLRIELGEIEDALDRHPAVQESVVVLASAHDERRRRLVAYWVAKPSGKADEAELRASLRERLPEYMIPAELLQLPAMPLLASGKVNRAALPSPDAEGAGERLRVNDAPRTELEALVAATFARVLGIAGAGIDDDFFELGGHSLLATRLVLELRRVLARDVPLSAITRAPTVARLAAFLGGAPLDDLDATILADAIPPSLDVEPIHDPRSPMRAVFVTGGTGFVGAFLVHELLRRTEAVLHCLVRASSVSEGKRRLLEAQARHGLSHSSAGSRIVAVLGDLEQPRLGLHDAGYESLATAVDTIFHSGAAVNFIRPYQTLRPANILGTRELLTFAAHRRTKHLHHLSTIAVLAGAPLRGKPVLFEEPLDPRPDGLPNSYAQSKWAAERMMQEAARQGLPVTIHRLGQVVGHSVSGVAQTGDFVAHFVEACVQTGTTLRSDAAIDLVPVDHVVQAIVTIAARRGGEAGAVHHIVNPHPVRWSAVVALLGQLGYPLVEMSFADFLRSLVADSRAGRENALAPYLAMMEEVREAMMKLPRFDRARTDAALEGSGLDCPPFDADFVRTLVGFYLKKGVLPADAASQRQSAR